MTRDSMSYARWFIRFSMIDLIRAKSCREALFSTASITGICDCMERIGVRKFRKYRRTAEKWCQYKIDKYYPLEHKY